MNYKKAFNDMNEDWFSGKEANKNIWAKFLVKDQVITPSSVIKNMIDKANIDWTNPNLKICDPCCGSGRFLIYCLIKLLEAGHSEKHIIENMLYGSDINPVCITFIEKFWKFNKYNHNLKSSSILNKEWDFRNMKFDLIIMNPPYSKNLHLKILAKAIEHISNNGKVINLSPVRWLQDPLAENKKNNDYHRFEKTVSKYIKDLEIIPADKGEELFGAAFNMDLGIYECDKTGGFNYKKFKIPLLDKIISNTTDFMQPHSKISIPDKHSLILSLMGGGNHGRTKETSYWITDFNKYYYFNGKNSNNETYEQYRQKVCWGNTKPRAEAYHYEFDTKDECINFFNSLNTIFFRYIFTQTLIDIHIHPEFYPYMGDYTKPWDNKRFCDHFKITGYISDSTAVPGSEWEEMLNIINQYK